MKRKFRYLCCFTAFALSTAVQTGQVFAQNTSFFPNGNAVWYSVFKEHLGFPTPITYQYWTKCFALSGDTLINNSSLKKYYAFTACDSTRNLSYYGAIRTDSLNKTVYLVPKDSISEYLLMDFSMVPGDTIYISNLWDNNIPLVCYDTGTYYINQLPHKFVQSYLSSYGFDYWMTWVEGIGSLYYPHDLYDLNGQGELTWYELNCLFVNDSLIYHDDYNPAFDDCYGEGIYPAIIGIEEKEKHYEFNVSPVPAQEIVSIEFGNVQNLQMAQLWCYDVFGNILHSEAVVPGQKEVVLDISSWPQGMYIAIVYSNDEVVGKCKFVVE